jgi:hypothetical protein
VWKYFAECDGALVRRLALQKIEKRAKAAIWVAGRLAVLESMDLEEDLVELSL